MAVLLVKENGQRLRLGCVLNGTFYPSFSVAGWQDSGNIPAIQFTGYDGEEVTKREVSTGPRTYTVRGWLRAETAADLDAIFNEIQSFVTDKGELKLYANDNAEPLYYALVRRISFASDYVYKTGRTACNVTITFRASKPHKYADAETVIVQEVHGIPGQADVVEAEAPRHYDVTMGNVNGSFSSWAKVTDANCSGGRILRSNVAGDYYDLIFYGAGISIICAKNNEGGKGEVSVDGEILGTFDTYAAATAYKQAVYSVAGLTPGRHTVRVRVTDTKNAASSGYYIALDAIHVLPSTNVTIETGSVDVEPAYYVQAVERLDSLDMLGKISGSTVENKNAIKYGSAADKITPDGAWSAEIGDYTGVERKDNIVHGETTNTAGHYLQTLVQFDLSHIAQGVTDKIKAGLLALTLNLSSYGHGKNGSADDWQNEVLLWNRSTNQYDSLGYTGAQFSRASEAYEGTNLVPTNQPRYGLGKFHNLLTANQADVEEGLDGFAQYGTVAFSQSTEWAKHGTHSLKIENSNSTNYCRLMLKNTKADTTFVISAYVYNPSTTETIEVKMENYIFTSVIVPPASEARIVSQPKYWGKAFSSVDQRIFETSGKPFYIDCLMLSEGTEVYDWQPGGTGKAVLVEEGTTNLIPADKQKFEGWIAFQGATVTLTQNQSVPEWGATDATRIQTNGGANVLKYYYAFGVGIADRYYAESVWIKNIGSTNLTLNSNQCDRQYTVPAGQQAHVKLENILASGTTGVIQIQFRAPTAEDSLDFIAWRPQVEQKAYATSFTPTERKAESLKIPLDGMQSLLDKGTIAIRVNVNDASKRGGVLPTIFRFRDKAYHNGYWLYYNGADYWSLQFNNGTMGLLKTSASYTPNGWHDFVVRWDKTQGKAHLYIDGVNRGEMESPHFIDTLDDYISIGNTFGNELDTTLCDLHISKEYWPDEKIATRAAATTWDTRDADTLYIASLSGDFATPCPFNKTLTANLGNYVDDNKVNVLVKSRYPSDGTTESGVYTDYVALRQKWAYAANPKIIRVAKNLVKDGNFALGGYWGVEDATKRKYGLTPLGVGYFMREGNSWAVAQKIIINAGDTVSFGVWARKSVGVGNGFRPRINISGFNSMGKPNSYDANALGKDSNEWKWITGTMSVPSNINMAYGKIFLLTNGGTGDIAQNASDFTGFTLVKGATPPEAYVPQKTKLLDVSNVTLLTGDTLALDSAARKAAKNGENVISAVNPQFAVYGLPLVGGESNAVQCEAADDSGPYSLTTIFRKMYY